MKVYKNLVHIGYAKAGSSFLQSWFQQNPNFVYVENAIVGFTNINNLFSYVYENDLSKTAYTKNDLQKQTYFVSSHEEIAFWQGPPQTEVVGIELKPYPVKAHQKQVAKYFKQLLLIPKVLIITRGFESMILSAYSQYIKVGGRLTLKGFTTQYEKLMLDFWDYDYIVNLYSELFGKKNIIVLPYELLQKNPTLFLENIEQKLDIEHFSFPTDKINPSLNVKEFYWTHYLSILVYRCIQIFSKKRQQKIYLAYVGKLIQGKFRFFSNIGQKLFPKKAMNLEIDKELLQKFENKATFIKKEAIYQDFLAVYLQNQK